MQITRHHHLRYMAKVTPLLLLLYVTQVLLYQRFAPSPISGEINLFLGIGLALIIVSYQFYDFHHKILFHDNYLEIRFDLFKMKEDILYQNIVHLELKKEKNNYGKISLYQKNGTRSELHHIDSPEIVIDYINNKKAKWI